MSIVAIIFDECVLYQQYLLFIVHYSTKLQCLSDTEKVGRFGRIQIFIDREHNWGININEYYLTNNSTFNSSDRRSDIYCRDNSCIRDGNVSWCDNSINFYSKSRVIRLSTAKRLSIPDSNTKLPWSWWLPLNDTVLSRSRQTPQKKCS